MSNKEKIENILRALGISRRYLGYDFIFPAVKYALEDPKRLQCVSKELWPLVAPEVGTTPYCVERNIRTVSRKAWENNRPLLEKLAGHKLPVAPSTIDLIDIFAQALERHYDKCCKADNQEAVA